MILIIKSPEPQEKQKKICEVSERNINNQTAETNIPTIKIVKDKKESKMEPNPGKPPGQQQQTGQRKPYYKKSNDSQKPQYYPKKKYAPEEQKAEDDIPKWNQQGMEITNQNRIQNNQQQIPFANNLQGQQFFQSNNNIQDGTQQQAQQRRNYPANQTYNNNNNNNNNTYKQSGNNRQNQRFPPSRNNNRPSQETPTPQETNIRTGVFIVDDFGNKFVQEIVNGEQIKERLYLYPKEDSINRAIHESKVQFILITETKFKSNKPSNKAQILNVLDYKVEELVGQFGSKTEGKRPKIDFDIASKTFDYSAENEFYFYPLETKYPRMICRLTDDEKAKYSNGELFKNYFKVNFIKWTEEMTNKGPECEIREMMGPLYDKSADIDALLCTIHKPQNSFPKKEMEEIARIKKKYQKKVTKQLKLFTNRTNLKVATIDSIGTSTFDDAISIQEISAEAMQREVEKVIAINSEQDNEEEKQPEKKQKGKKESLTKEQQSKQKKISKVKKDTKAAKSQYVSKENTDQQLKLVDDNNNAVETSNIIAQDVPDEEVIENAQDQQEQQGEQKETESPEQDQQLQFFSAQEKFAVVPDEQKQEITQENPQPQERVTNEKKKKKKNNKKPEDADNKKPTKNTQKKNTRSQKNSKKVGEEEKKEDQDSEEEKKDQADDSDDSDSDESDADEEEEKAELENLESSSSSGIFRIGIHISELSETIQKGQEIYKGAEKRGQSIYLLFGRRSKAVSHMIPFELLKLFSLKQNSTKLANTLFFCIAQSESNPDEFQILWETLRFELTKIKPAANYTYHQLDIAVESQNKSRNTNILEQAKNQENLNEDQDIDINDEEYQDYLAAQSNESNRKCLWSPRESNALIQFGQFLSRKREQKGQRVFQEDADDNENRSLSSVTVEELMVLYNQEVSRKLQVKQHLIKGEKLLTKEVASIQEKLALLVKNIEKQMKALQKREEPIKASLSKINKLMVAKQTLRNSKKKQVLNNSKVLQQKEKQLQQFAKQREQLSNQLLKLQEKKEEENSVVDKEDLFDEQEWRNKFMFQQKEREEEEGQEEQEEAEIDEKQQQKQTEENNNQDNLSENSDYSYQNQEESHSEQGDAHEEREYFYNPFDFKLKSIVALILSKDKDISDILTQLLAKEKELNSPEANANNFDREKRSFLKQVEYFERQCKEVGFEDLKYGDLEELRVSFEKLKRNPLIKEIVKKYLLFKKRAISRDLSKYFGIVEKEKKVKKELQVKIKDLKEKLQKAKTEKDNLSDKQRKLQDQQEQYKSLHTGQASKAQCNLVLFEKEEQEEEGEQQQQESDRQQEIQIGDQEYHQKINFSDDESVGDSDAIQQYLNSSASTQDGRERSQAQSKHEKTLKRLQKNIDQLEKQSMTIEKFIAENPATLITITSQLEKIDAELATLKETAAEVDKEAQTLKGLKKEFQDEIKKLENQSKEEIEELNQSCKRGSEELFKHQEIIPESNVYVTATSPIRKFADILTQQMLIKYILSQEGSSKEFDKEYTSLLNKKDKSTTNSNIVRQYQDKAKTLNKYRNDLYNKLKKGMQSDKTEEILQIKLKYVPPRNIFDFFLPDETCQTSFVSSQRSEPTPNFQIWVGLIQPKLTLPFGFVLTDIQTETPQKRISLSAN